MRHRIVIVQDVIPLYTASLFAALSRLDGVELTVIADVQTPRQLNQYDQSGGGFRVLNIPLRSKVGFKFRPGLVGAITALAPSIVILNCSMSAISEQAMLVRCKRRGIPVGIWDMFHRVGANAWYRRAYDALRGRIADLLLVYGKRGFDELMGVGVSEDRAIIVSTAVDERQVVETRDSITELELAQFKKEQNLIGKHVLLQVVRLTKIKKPEILIHCFHALLRRRADVLLVLIGGGPLEQEMRELVSKLGIYANVRFTGPIYDERLVGLWYKSCTVFVMATCIGLSIHHAMIYGVPVVTDDNIQTQASEFEVLENGVNGFAYKAGSMEDFADKVERILDDPALRHRMSSAAVMTIVSKYTLAHKVEKFRLAFNLLAS